MRDSISELVIGVGNKLSEYGAFQLHAHEHAYELHIYKTEMTAKTEAVSQAIRKLCVAVAEETEKGGVAKVRGKLALLLADPVDIDIDENENSSGVR